MRKRKLIALISLLFLLPCLILPVSANSAQQRWSGTDASGAVITDGDSPILVEKELLTFDLAEFPANYYSNQENFLAYTGKVTAEYTFYNPSDMTVTATLAFPFGELPDYAYEYEESNVNKYGVTINGEAIQKTIRHTPSLFSYSTSKRFDLEGSLDLLSDEYITKGIYSPDTTVTVYSWKIDYTVDESESIKNPTFACDIGKSDGTRAIYFPNQRCGHLLDNGEYRIGGSQNYSSPILYVFGEPLQELPEWTLYSDSGCKDGEEIDAEFSFYESKTITLLDFALERREENSPVSDVDWYNIVVHDLVSSVRNDGYPLLSLNEYSLMRWYQYEITLEPGEHILNTVTAPMYPAIDMSYSPTVFEYTYLVSPASTWSDFGELKIVINTPYYLVDCSYQGFEKTDNGYELILDGMPRDDEGKVTDLIFELSTSENPESTRKLSTGVTFLLIILAIIVTIIFLPLVIIGFVIYGVVNLVRNITNK